MKVFSKPYNGIRRKRDWLIPHVSIVENDKGPFPKQVVKVYLFSMCPIALNPVFYVHTAVLFAQSNLCLYVLAPQMKSTAPDSMIMIYEITGAGANEPPINLFKVDKYSGMLWVTKAVDREETEEYTVSDLWCLKFLDIKRYMIKLYRL